MEDFRKNAAESLKATPKSERKRLLSDMQQTDEYWNARIDKLKTADQKAEFSPDRTSLRWKVKNVYHGSDIEGIQEFNYADESTIGDNAVYFTIDPGLAMGYAKLRSRERSTGKGHLYEAVLSDVAIMNWAENQTVALLKKEYAAYCGKLLKEWQQIGYGEFAKKYNLPSHLKEGTVHYALEKIITNCEREDFLHGGNIKEVAQGVMGMFFERFVTSSGFDGVITIEGGDDADLTAKAGVSVVIYNKDKILSHRRLDVATSGVNT